jgi:hypothetical protein
MELHKIKLHNNAHDYSTNAGPATFKYLPVPENQISKYFVFTETTNTFNGKT